MKEDMGKIQKDNKQGVVCIRCAGCCAGRHHVTGKLEPGCTRRNETFYCIILVQKVPFLFLYHNTGRACHEKILEVFQRAAKRRIFYY